MPRLLSLTITCSCLTAFWPAMAYSQVFDVRRFLVDYTNVQREEAEAKRVRLEWISKERVRIHGELQKYETERSELNKLLPDPVKLRVLPPAVARTRQREQISFNNFAANNDPAMTGAIRSGSAINALLRVLGPIAHSRKLRMSANPEGGVFESLKADYKILESEVSHFRLTSGAAANANVVQRVNQLPLDLSWPVVLVEKWPVECRDVGTLRDDYVRLLNSAAASDTRKRAERAEVLDGALELLQAKVLREKNHTPHNPALDAHKKNRVLSNLREALNYLTTVRASAEEFKQAPSQFMVHKFAGGTVEDFLDFCHSRGMFFKDAQPDDKMAYYGLYKKMQDYAQDVQRVEDWKSDLEIRINELSQEDREIIVRASTQ